MNNKIYGLMGLCKRAGHLKSGEFSSENSIKGGKTELLIIAMDASDNTKKKFVNMCKYRNVPYFIWGSTVSLGHAIGKSERSSISINDKGFAEQLIKLFDGGNVYVR